MPVDEKEMEAMKITIELPDEYLEYESKENVKAKYGPILDKLEDRMRETLKKSVETPHEDPNYGQTFDESDLAWEMWQQAREEYVIMWEKAKSRTDFVKELLKMVIKHD